MQGFRQYLQDIEAELNRQGENIYQAYSSGKIQGEYYNELTRGVNGRKLMLDNISREYERTHKIWE